MRERAMMNPKVLPLTIAALAFFAFALVTPAVAASSQSSGSANQYVVYSINTTGPNRSFSATVNETVVPSSSNGLATVTLQMISGNANLSYSKLVNATQKLFPILPSLGTRSINLTIKNTTISASVTQTGTQSINFSGTNYTLTNYSFSLTVQKHEKTGSGSGQLAIFPSGLVYSATVNINGTSEVNAQLLSTNISLGLGSSGSNTTTMAIAGGAGSLLAGVGAFAFFRHERKNNNNNNKSNSGSETEKKPLHWVD
ncbi:MAG: hypothetical protein ACREBS_08505 [Nitrososphaerales archaeon]